MLIAHIGVALLMLGFFKTRRELQLISECPMSTLQSHSCSQDPTFNKVVFFIIDALRLDFVTSSSTPFIHLHDLLTSNASQARLFGFQADPPTVTSQRLKGLTTGSFPTFIDIGSNFGSSAIEDDNIMHQMKRKGFRSLPNSTNEHIWLYYIFHF